MEPEDPLTVHNRARRSVSRLFFSRLFGIDYRSLALFRVMLGITLIFDLWTQWPILQTFHMRGGAYDPQALATYYEGIWNWSLFWITDAPPFGTFLFAVAGVASICLLIGWHSRLASIVAWAVITSLNEDAPPLTSASDGLLCLLLLWSIFLPLGRYWSLDARRLPRPSRPVLTSVATTGVLLQMAMIYFFSGIGKWTPPWLDGTALGLVLANPNVTRPAGAMLGSLKIVSRALTWGSLTAELVLPFALFSPWKTAALRSASIVMLIAMHVGIQLTMHVLIFSVVALTGLTCFIPSAWWDGFPLHHFASLLDRVFSRAVARASIVQPVIAPRQPGPVAKTFGLMWGLVMRAMLAVLIVYCLAYNLIDNFAPPGTAQRWGWFQQFGVAMRLTQRWSMFYDPRNQCFEAALIGRKANGAYVDLFRPGKIVFDRTTPPAQAGQYPCERVLQLVLILPNSVYIPFRRGFVENALQEWNAGAAPPERLVDLYLTYYPQAPHEMAGHPYIDMWHVKYNPTQDGLHGSALESGDTMPAGAASQ